VGSTEKIQCQLLILINAEDACFHQKVLHNFESIKKPLSCYFETLFATYLQDTPMLQIAQLSI
jgi:hypothetical protein